MAKLRTERDVTLTIIGKPKDGKSMDLLRSLGLLPHVHFVSGVTDERIVELYAEAELAVVPSLYEGFSLPAIEAMVTGTALVATDGGALPEVTGRDGETVLSCRGRRRRCAGDDDRPRPRRPRAAGPGRRRRPPAGARALDAGGAAPSRPSTSTARCWRCRPTSRSRAATAEDRRDVLTIRSARLAALGVEPGALRPRRRRRLRPPRLRARPPGRARRRPRLRQRRGRRHARHVRGDGRGGRDPGRALRRRAARRRHAAAVRRRRRSTPS